MHITLTSPAGDTLACVAIIEDEYGYLYVNHHPVFNEELDIALYGYQEGQVNSHHITDEDGVPYIFWSVGE